MVTPKNTTLSFLSFFFSLFVTTFFLSANPLTPEQLELLKKEFTSLVGNNTQIANVAACNDLFFEIVGKTLPPSPAYRTTVGQMMREIEIIRESFAKGKKIESITNLMRHKIELLIKQLQEALYTNSQKQELNEQAKAVMAAIQDFQKINNQELLLEGFVQVVIDDPQQNPYDQFRTTIKGARSFMCQGFEIVKAVVKYAHQVIEHQSFHVNEDFRRNEEAINVAITLEKTSAQLADAVKEDLSKDLQAIKERFSDSISATLTRWSFAAAATLSVWAHSSRLPKGRINFFDFVLDLAIAPRGSIFNWKSLKESVIRDVAHTMITQMHIEMLTLQYAVAALNTAVERCSRGIIEGVRNLEAERKRNYEAQSAKIAEMQAKIDSTAQQIEEFKRKAEQDAKARQEELDQERKAHEEKLQKERAEREKKAAQDVKAVQEKMDQDRKAHEEALQKERAEREKIETAHQTQIDDIKRKAAESARIAKEEACLKADEDRSVYEEAIRQEHLACEKIGKELVQTRTEGAKAINTLQQQHQEQQRLYQAEQQKQQELQRLHRAEQRKQARINEHLNKTLALIMQQMAQRPLALEGAPVTAIIPAAASAASATPVAQPFPAPASSQESSSQFSEDEDSDDFVQVMPDEEEDEADFSKASPQSGSQ